VNSSAGITRHLAWPRPLARFSSFLRGELAAFPGRGNMTLRCLLGSAIVIVVSTTLQVPELAVSLIAVFFVTQANVVLTRMIALNLLIGTTCAIACTIGVYELTFDYPLLRIVIASAAFFCCTYLMRAVTKFGLVFFLMSLVVIYGQTFADLTDDAEALVRGVLWLWSAINYAVAVALVINTLFLPVEPERQLREAMRRQLAAIDVRLGALIGALDSDARLDTLDLQRDALSLQKLLRFATMRRRYSAADASAMLACVTTVSRIGYAAASLSDDALVRDAERIAAIKEVQGELDSLGRAIGDDAQWPYWTARVRAPVSISIAGVAAIQRALDAFRDAASTAGPPLPLRVNAMVGAESNAAAEKPVPRPALLSADAWTNPRYARFALRTLLSVLICYVFYNAVNWPGIHTIMLTCLIVALPSLGASSRHGMLRIGGALIGSGLALFMVAFVIPHLESVTGLLLMSLPVIALGAWVSAGSERISYAGVQIMFTFALALLESFAPPSDLTEIRDRMVGILLGVGVATFIQASVWPEGESDALRAQLAAVLREIAALARANALALSGVREHATQALASTTRAKLADCDAMLARVALEPDWREGETEHVTLMSQTVLAQSRAILIAVEAFHNEAMADASAGAPVERTGKFQTDLADELEHYAVQLATAAQYAQTPASIEAGEWSDMPAGAERGARAEVLARKAQRINAALGGLPGWAAITPVAEG
jgi:multidrug resistance protein MdtO